jgi:hypothetical protein
MTTGEFSPTGEAHPGTIHFVDHRDGSEYDEAAADNPQLIAWTEVEGEWVPVTRVETAGNDAQVETTVFGPDGRFLKTTLAYLGPA